MEKFIKMMSLATIMAMSVGFYSCDDDDSSTPAPVQEDCGGSFCILNPLTGDTLSNNENVSLLVDDTIRIVYQPDEKYSIQKGFKFDISCDQLEKVKDSQNLFVGKAGDSKLNFGNNSIDIVATFDGNVREQQYKLSHTQKYTLVLSKISLNVTPRTIQLKANGGERSKVSIESNVSWEVTSSDNWLKVTKGEGTGNGEIEIYAEDNEGSASREGIIAVSPKKGNGIKQEIKVVQDALSVLYKEPCTVWGASITQTKNYMNDYTLYSEDEEMLVYMGKHKETLVAYSFDDGKLYASIVAISITSTSVDEISNQLKRNGYQVIGNSDDGFPIFVSKDYKTGVGISKNDKNNAYFVNYVDANYKPSTPSGALFEVPYTNWGTLRSVVKSEMNNRGYSLVQESTNSAEMYYLAYKGKCQETLSMYTFDENQKLNRVIISLQESVANISKVGDFLTSELNYTYLSSSEGAMGYVSKDYTTIVLVSSSTSNGTTTTNVMFMDVSNLAGSRSIKEIGQTDVVIQKYHQNLSAVKNSLRNAQIGMSISTAKSVDIPDLKK